MLLAVTKGSRRRVKEFPRPPSLRCHQGGMNPPLILIHGNALNRCETGYRPLLDARVQAALNARHPP